ncbi:hypothetical protein [Herbiconiux flava]|uniref:Putative membrane protein n=1 Tax=Herbiconiux flava TaxID=881268 RepID=A0A852SJ24_9MICO|nr:hypothetical protein [Herbiconiux flava]NYD69390.1 putative membrane protein [Herbiconiux flava]GLK16135.1 hypothetical protein GCM10017602_06170 [Herbiconiux flava]
MSHPGSTPAPLPGPAPETDELTRLIADNETDVTDRPGVRAAQAGISLGVLLAVVVPLIALLIAAVVTAIVSTAPIWLSGFFWGSFTAL